MRVLYHLPLSPYARKVRLALAEKRIPFELRIEKVWERRPEFLAMNPAGTVPVFLDENGLCIAESSAICEYLDEAYPDITLFGRTLAERAEVRRLVAWFDLKFGAEVTRNLVWERHLKRLLGLGQPDAGAIRTGYAKLKEHLAVIARLAEERAWLGGAFISLADFAAAAHLSVLDYLGDVDWSLQPAAKEWYARIKSRPAFRPLLAERVSGIPPSPDYDNLDF
ncbi:MAG: glutathione S-transferase family protein [Rhodovarius sp.]|nr:glutathione S-transferase family protein [Rhodovarius sp.]MCX7931433.1 glutathione S-transferase family protein [Rhodovarius sp.]MDW8315049.1 glutathione S-transferase family protein [Rhodovarius sp.]